MEEDVAQNIPEKRGIIIKVISYENLVPVHQVADIIISAQFMGNILGESERLPVIAGDVVEIDQDFVLEFDDKSSNEIEALASFPVLLTINEYIGTMDPDIYALPLPTPDQNFDTFMTAESAADIADALVEDDKKIDRNTIEPKEVEKEKREEKKKKAKEKKAAKGSKGSKGSKDKGSKKTKSETKQPQVKDNATKEPQIPDGPIEIGNCTLDLLPLILGEVEIKETLLVRRPPELRTYLLNFNTVPNVVVKAYTKDELPVLSKEKDEGVEEEHEREKILGPNIFNVTLECIYNLPDVMKRKDLKCKLCMFLPNSKNVGD